MDLSDAELAAKGWTRETEIHRDASGRWFENGAALEHPKLERAFSRWLTRADNGRLCLKNNIHYVYVTVEGPHLFVRSARLDDGALTGQKLVTLSLSDETEEVLDAETLFSGPDDALYCTVRQGRLTARFDNGAVMVLADVLDADDEGPFFTLGGSRVRPARRAVPLCPEDARRPDR